MSYQSNIPYHEISNLCQIYPSFCQNTNQNVRVNTLPDGTPQISTGGTTLDKLLTALTTNIAIIKGAGYIPTQTQPQQQVINPYPIGVNPYPVNNNIGGSLGTDIQNFITNNTGLLLIAGVGVVLWKSGRK